MASRFRRARILGRAVSYVARQHAGTAVTESGLAAALGGVLAAVGLVQISHDRHPAPLENGWVVAGLVFSVLAALFGLGVLIVLVVSRIRHERTRTRIVLQHAVGSMYLNNLEDTTSVPTAEINKWEKETQELLSRADPGFGVRFMNAAGLPLPQEPFDNEPHKMYQTALSNRTARLAEFISELER